MSRAPSHWVRGAMSTDATELGQNATELGRDGVELGRDGPARQGDGVELSAAPPGLRDEQTASVLNTLSPTARRIIRAAHRVLDREGYEGLSLRRVALEAGVAKSLIIYHFQTKAGLVATLVDSLWHDADVALVDEVDALAADLPGRLHALVGLHHRLAVQQALYRTWFDLFPHILRDPDAGARLRRTYRSYRRIGQRCLAPGRTADAATAAGGAARAVHSAETAAGNAGAIAAGAATLSDDEALALATVLLAAGEGLGVSFLLRGDAAAVAAAFAVLEARAARHMGVEVEPTMVVLRATQRAVPPGGRSTPAHGQATRPGGRAPQPHDQAAGAGSGGPGTGGDDGAASLRGLEDPAAGLAPAPARVLRCAVDLLSEQGLQALTAESLARRSGEPSSSVLYYFGDKRGLIARVVAAADYRFAQSLIDAARPAPQAPAGVADIQAAVLQHESWMRTFFDVLPAVIRDDALRSQQAAFEARILHTVASLFTALGAPPGEAVPLAALTVALTYGLAVQKLVDPRGAPVRAALATWRALLAQTPPAGEA